ncbi:unnamed protein product [Tuber melanosporum]|uniref:(Perigord truffle) hypothetical protein n=1 Tax=Tuber melanosporum (strain Mel28) TaxID=656061 RepID=D5GE15_TUBMM|nr:uncharacterized protein GSTUM_00001178001 [Tuber melanosporum]CAZ82758.1 unnamed protein product [Tuber melanosporum]
MINMRAHLLLYVALPAIHSSDLFPFIFLPTTSTATTLSERGFLFLLFLFLFLFFSTLHSIFIPVYHTIYIAGGWGGGSLLKAFCFFLFTHLRLGFAFAIAFKAGSFFRGLDGVGVIFAHFFFLFHFFIFSFCHLSGIKIKLKSSAK